MARRIGLTMRVAAAGEYREWRDCIAQDWAPFMARALPEAIWMLIPNLGSGVLDYVEQWSLDGFILTGGNDVGENPLRDETEQALLGFALEHRRPLLGVCRGTQVIQHFLGGKVDACSKEIHTARCHPVEFVAATAYASPGTSRTVNSFHRYAVFAEQLAGSLKPVALAEDGVVEALHHSSRPVVGIQWHPERQNPAGQQDLDLIRWLFSN